MIIAVDGPSAAGKGTIAKAIAADMGYHFLDTGALYRMVGLQMLRDGCAADDVQHAVAISVGLDPSQFQDVDLRNEKVAAITSQIAQIQDVRDALIFFQREFADRQPGSVLDGRDIGTVICPQAEVKLFITASAEVRATRRYEELLSRGESVTLEDIRNDVALRDARDRIRTIQAKDAVVIDTSNLSVAEGIAMALAVVRSKI